MNKRSLMILSLLITSFYLMSIKNTLAQETEDQWDFSGVMRTGSDQDRYSYFLPTEHGYNETVGNYTRPILYMEIYGFDTDGDILMDVYYGFWGVNLFDTSHLNYSTHYNLFRVVLNEKWSLRIPEGSDANWEVLFYPDPLFIKLNLLWHVPIYYVNLTKSVGVNLEWRLDHGLNYTIGNFTTFGQGNPLVPDIPTFPGYNVSVPLFTANLPLEELVATSFFDGPVSFIAIVSIIFGGYYIKRKWIRKK